MNNSTQLKELVNQGALIIDLRSKDEFEKDHIAGSLSIPFNSLNSKLLKSNFIKFRKKEAVLVCSDKRTECPAAKELLEAQGMTRVYDGGDWKELKSLLDAKSE